MNSVGRRRSAFGLTEEEMRESAETLRRMAEAIDCHARRCARDGRERRDGDGVDSEETEGDETQGDSNNDARKCRFGKIDGTRTC